MSDLRTDTGYQESVDYTIVPDPAVVHDPGEELLLLDPSVLLGDAGFGWLADVPSDERTRFVVAQTFYLQVVGRAEYTAADEELWGKLPDGAARQQLVLFLAGLRTFSESAAVSDLPPEVAEVAHRLRSMGSQVAVEQWLYLHSNSFLAARTHKILEHFKHGGAKVVEVSGNGVNDVTCCVLKAGPGLQVRVLSG